jgi:hypothetical protein
VPVCPNYLILKRLTSQSRNPCGFCTDTLDFMGLGFFVGSIVGDGVADGEGARVKVGVGVFVGIRIGILVGIRSGIGVLVGSVTTCRTGALYDCPVELPEEPPPP